MGSFLASPTHKAAAEETAALQELEDSYDEDEQAPPAQLPDVGFILQPERPDAFFAGLCKRLSAVQKTSCAANASNEAFTANTKFCGQLVMIY